MSGFDGLAHPSGDSQSAGERLALFQRMPIEQDAARLRELANQRISRGTLPRRVPSVIWAGYGAGGPCVVCDGDLACEQTELELEVDPRDGDPGGTFRMHVRCHAAWESIVLGTNLRAAPGDAIVGNRERKGTIRRSG